MKNTEDEHFVRASILLLKGGRLTSKGILNRELRKTNDNLDTILQKHERKLRYQFVNKQNQKLFQVPGGSNVEKWDLAMLVTVTRTVFKQSLSEDEKNALKSLKCMRDEVYAHTYSSSLTVDEYDEIRNKLEDAITSLSNGLSDNLKDDCAKIIHDCTIEAISPSLKAELTKQLEDTEALFQAVMDKLRDQKEFLCEMRKEIMDKLNIISVTEDRSEKVIKVIDTELKLSGAVNESSDIDFVEDVITTVINKAIKKVGNENDHPRIRKVVEKILEDINSMPDVEVLPAEHKCILLKFRCTTYIGILNLLMYLESRSFLDSLNDLAIALDYTFPKSGHFRLDMTVTQDCLENLLHELSANKMATTKYERTIRVPIQIKSVRGIKHIWSLFETGGATNTLNELSEAVFEEFNTKITVTPSVNLEQVHESVKEAEVSHKAVEDDASSHQIHQTFDKDEQSSRSTEEFKEVIQDAFAAKQHQSEYSENEVSQKAVEDDASSHQIHQTIDEDTNEIYRHLREVKSRSFKQSSDSGICSDTVSSITGRSMTSEEYPESTEGRFEPVIGTSVDIAIKDEINISSTTVGPVVIVNGYKDKCFITTGGIPTDIEDFTVNGHKETLRVLANNPNDSTILIAPVQRDMFIEKQIEEVNDCTASCTFEWDEELIGQRVLKFGAKTGLTHGIITGTLEIRLGGPGSIFQNVLLVGSLGGINEECFALTGDSGALVIHQDFNASWTCVGVLLGSLQILGSEELFIVRPIKDILKDFKSFRGLSVVIDKVYMDRHVSEILEKINTN